MAGGLLGMGSRAWAAVFGAPAALGLLVFLIIPFVMAFMLTFTNQKLMSPNDGDFVGLRNYERVLAMTVLSQAPERNAAGDLVRDEAGDRVFPRVRDVTRTEPKYDGFRPLLSFEAFGRRNVVLARDPAFMRSLFNTFLFALMVVPLQCAVALALAMLVNAGLRGQTALRAVYFSPVVMSMVVVSVVWSFLFNKDLGLINQFLSWISFGAIGPTDWLGNPGTAMPSISVMSAWQGAGFQMLIFLAGLQGISQELYDAARIDGANPWQRFVNVTLPGLKNTIAFVIIVTTIAAFGLFTQVDVMTQGGPQNATSTVMFHAVQKGVREQDISYGSTVTVIYFCIIAAIAILQQRYFAGRDA
ncbi:MAG: sugar ABC transporter permease [Pseudomonadota bacterium]